MALPNIQGPASSCLLQLGSYKWRLEQHEHFGFEDIRQAPSTEEGATMLLFCPHVVIAVPFTTSGLVELQGLHINCQHFATPGIESKVEQLN